MLQVKSKQQIIEAICEHNRSAAREFLINFEERALENYLERLTTLQNHRGHGHQMGEVWGFLGLAPLCSVKPCGVGKGLRKPLSEEIPFDVRHGPGLPRSSGGRNRGKNEGRFSLPSRLRSTKTCIHAPPGRRESSGGPRRRIDAHEKDR